MSRTPERRRAIIIGGGIAGLLAARVLLDHFEQVTIIERDHYPEKPVFRPGTPQARHAHVMLLRGQQALEALFPGLQAKLLAQGAITCTYGSDEAGSLYYYGGRCPQIPAVLHGWNCSRSLLEWQIRQELRPSSHLQIMEGYEVLHLLPSQAVRTVSGVQLRARGQTISSDNLQELHADLIVDASGSTSRIVPWLEELGYPPPQERSIPASLGYATRLFRPSSPAPWKEIGIQTTEQHYHGGVLMTVEDGLWMVVLSGRGQGHYPPIDEKGWMAFAQELPEPALYETIKDATPLSPIYGYRRPDNRLRRFCHLPKGLIVLGDALCTFNPIYGQGMTIAALEAQLLNACLRQQSNDYAHLFQRKAARLLAFPWQLAAASDARFSSLSARANAFRYTDRFIELLPHDQQAMYTFLRVIHMIQTPLALFQPFLMAKIFARWFLK